MNSYINYCTPFRNYCIVPLGTILVPYPRRTFSNIKSVFPQCIKKLPCLPLFLITHTNTRVRGFALSIDVYGTPCWNGYKFVIYCKMKNNA